LRPRGNLAAHVAAVGVGDKHLGDLPLGFREADTLPVGRVGEVLHRRAVGALTCRALLVDVGDEDVGGLVAQGEVGNLPPVGSDTEDAVGHPVDAALRAHDGWHTYVVALLGDFYEFIAALLGYVDHGEVDLLSVGGRQGGEGRSCQ